MGSRHSLTYWIMKGQDDLAFTFQEVLDEDRAGSERRDRTSGLAVAQTIYKCLQILASLGHDVTPETITMPSASKRAVRIQ